MLDRIKSSSRGDPAVQGGLMRDGLFACGAVFLSLAAGTVILTQTSARCDDYWQIDLTEPGGNITYNDCLSGYMGSNAFDNGPVGNSSRWLSTRITDAWVCYEFEEPATVCSYAVTGFPSDNNGLARDPRAWVVEALSDSGEWTVLDTQTNQTDWNAVEKRVFQFANRTAFKTYRFRITENNGATDYTGCVELEFYSTTVGRFDSTGADGNISFSDSLADYPGTKAFDDGLLASESRWLASVPSNAWIRYDFNGPVVVLGYSVTGLLSDNMGPERNPKSWLLEGSRDGDIWETLDIRTDQTDWNSAEKRVFRIENDRSFSAYRLTITENNGASDYTGCLEIELYTDPLFSGVPCVKMITSDSSFPESGSVSLDATLLSGDSAVLTFMWGTSPDEMNESVSVRSIAPEISHVDITDLPMGKTYYWTVFAQNDYGVGSADEVRPFLPSTGEDLTSPDGGIISGTPGHSDFPPKNVFDDGGKTSSSRWLSDASALPDVWVQYEFMGGARIVMAYSITCLGSNNFDRRSPKSWTLSGSNNGTDWTVLDTRTEQSSWLTEYEVRTYAVDNRKAFSMYRLTITANDGATDYAGISELELFGRVSDYDITVITFR